MSKKDIVGFVRIYYSSIIFTQWVILSNAMKGLLPTENHQFVHGHSAEIACYISTLGDFTYCKGS